MARIVASRRTSSTRRAPPASRRACSATPAATRSRSRRRCAASSASSRARRCSRPATSAGSSATRTSSTAPLINGATTIMYEGLPIRPDPAHLVEDRRRAQGEDDVQLADRDPRAEEAGPGVHEAARPLDAQVPVPRRRAARRADGALGVRLARRARSSTTTGRPRPAGRSSPRMPGVEETPRKFGSPSFPVYGYDVRLLREGTGEEVGRRREGRADDHAAAAARLHDDGLGRRRALRQDLLLRLRHEARVLDVRLGDARRRRLLLRARPHRRRDQRRRPPARHARDRGGGAGALRASPRSPSSASPIR